MLPAPYISAFFITKSFLQNTNIINKIIIYTGVKEVTLRGVKGEISLAGAKDLRMEEGGAHFLYSGSPKELMAGLAQVEFEDINISDPDLDDVLMHYYEKRGEGV